MVRLPMSTIRCSVGRSSTATSTRLPSTSTATSMRHADGPGVGGQVLLRLGDEAFEVAVADEALRGLAQRYPLGQEEHLAGDAAGEHLVGSAVGQHLAQHAEGVGDLQPAQQVEAGPLRGVGHGGEGVDLGRQQAAGGRRQHLLEGHHGRARRGAPRRRRRSRRSRTAAPGCAPGRCPSSAAGSA